MSNPPPARADQASNDSFTLLGELGLGVRGKVWFPVRYGQSKLGIRGATVKVTAVERLECVRDGQLEVVQVEVAVEFCGGDPRRCTED